MSINPDPYITLIETLSHPDLKVRKAAIKALSQLGDCRAIPTLLYLLDAKETPIRIEAMRALGKLKDARAIEPLIRILQTDSSGMAFCVPAVLARFSDPRVPSTLIQALNSPDIVVRQYAAQACGRLREPRAVPGLIAIIEEMSDCGSSFDPERDSGLRNPYWAAMDALGKIKDPQAIPVLIRALDDGFFIWGTSPWNYETHCGAIARKLAPFGDAAIPFLLEALENESVLVRTGAVMALKNLKYWTIVPTVIKILQDKDRLIIAEAVDFLGQSGDPQAMQVLIERIDKTPNGTVPQVPLLLNVEAGRAALLEYIQNGRASDNARLYIAIGHWMVMGKQDDRFVSVLQDGLTSEIESIRKAAADALSRLPRTKNLRRYR